MLNKEQKIRLILDVKNGIVTKNILNILRNQFVVLIDKDWFCNCYNLPPDEFDEVYNYIEKLCGWKIIKPC